MVQVHLPAWDIIFLNMLIPIGMITTICIALALLVAGIRIIDQYEKGVILTLGRYTSTRSAGINWVFPFIQRMIKVDLRVTALDIPRQEVITKDNVPAHINGVVYFKVERPSEAILGVQNYAYAVQQYAQSALRDVVGRVELDVLLTERDHVANDIEGMIKQEIAGWGIDVISIKIQDIELPADMKRVMARQAEAERERRAVVIRAEGELTASHNLRLAAENLVGVPGGLSLRTLTTIESVDKATMFVLPMEILEGFKNLTDKK